ncbi:MAG: M16 family metallopeptidase, partial [Myxococcota bacterium]
GQPSADFRVRNQLQFDAALMDDLTWESQLNVDVYNPQSLANPYLRGTSATPIFDVYLPESLLRYNPGWVNYAAGIGAMRDHMPLGSSLEDPFKRNIWTNATGGYGFVGTPGLATSSLAAPAGGTVVATNNAGAATGAPIWFPGTNVIVDVLDPNNSQAWGPTGNLLSSANFMLGPVALGIGFQRGALSSPYLQPGATTAFGATALPGFQTWNMGSQAIATAGLNPAMLGASLNVGQGDEAAWVSVDALTGEALAPSLDLLAEVALKPKFDEGQFKRVKAETITAIQSQRAEPRDVVARAFSAQLFGTAHPYGTPSIGSEASVSAITSKDVKSFYGTWWHAKNAAIVVAGAVKQEDIQPLLEARFGAWKAGKATRASAPPPAPLAKTRVVFVEQPGAVQSVIRLGTTGVARTSPDYPSANVAGTLLAGMFSSRVNMNLREEKGWSYGAYGGFSDTRDHGVFAVRTSVQADKTAPAVSELLKELQAAGGRTPTDAELTMTRDYLLKSLPGNFETNAATATSFVGAAVYGLGPDLWTKYVADLGAVSADQAASSAKRFFDPARQLVVVA